MGQFFLMIPLESVYNLDHVSSNNVTRRLIRQHVFYFTL
jgi:hypothetical protein